MSNLGVFFFGLGLVVTVSMGVSLIQANSGAAFIDFGVAVFNYGVAALTWKESK